MSGSVIWLWSLRPLKRQHLMRRRRSGQVWLARWRGVQALSLRQGPLRRLNASHRYYAVFSGLAEDRLGIDGKLGTAELSYNESDDGEQL